MSKLADAITAKQVGKAYENPKLFDIREETVWDKKTLDLVFQYRLGVHLQINALAKDEDELHYVQRNAKERIIEEVFGEFRKPLYELESLLHLRKNGEAIYKIREILEQMFS